MDLSLCNEFPNLQTTIFDLTNPGSRRLNGSGGSDEFLARCAPLHNMGGVAVLILGIMSSIAVLDSHWYMLTSGAKLLVACEREACLQFMTYQVWVLVLWEHACITLLFSITPTEYPSPLSLPGACQAQATLGHHSSSILRPRSAV